VGSKTFDGVRFMVYVADHSPRHVHGFLAEVSVIVDLLPENKVAKSKRWDSRTTAEREAERYPQDSRRRSGPRG
jgi:hypothetical protein